MAEIRNALSILRLKQAKERTGLSRSTIYSLIAKHEFPKQIALGPRSIGFVESEVEDWIKARIDQSRNTETASAS